MSNEKHWEHRVNCRQHCLQCHRSWRDHLYNHCLHSATSTAHSSEPSSVLTGTHHKGSVHGWDGSTGAALVLSATTFSGAGTRSALNASESSETQLFHYSTMNYHKKQQTFVCQEQFWYFFSFHSWNSGSHHIRAIFAYVTIYLTTQLVTLQLLG